MDHFLVLEGESTDVSFAVLVALIVPIGIASAAFRVSPSVHHGIPMNTQSCSVLADLAHVPRGMRAS